MVKFFYSLLLFPVFLLSSCNTEDSKSEDNNTNLIIEEFQEVKSQSKVEFMGVNMINGAHYHVYISCKNGVPVAYRNIPDTQTVQISLLNDCKNSKLSAEMFDEITKKKFYYVYWFFEFYLPDSASNSDITAYSLSDEEVEKIARAPWDILNISGLEKEQYKILRNTHNNYPKLFEPTGDPNIYTPEENKICNKYWKEISDENNEQEVNIISNKIINCYKNLPPIK